MGLFLCTERGERVRERERERERERARERVKKGEHNKISFLYVRQKRQLCFWYRCSVFFSCFTLVCNLSAAVPQTVK